MAADEEPWWADKQVLADRGIIFARISADVLDEYIRAFDGEAVYFRIAQTDFTTIDIATYRTEGPESLKLIGHVKRTYITSMPYLVTLGKVPGITFVPIAMSI
jgi:hypothetical protein